MHAHTTDGIVLGIARANDGVVTPALVAPFGIVPRHLVRMADRGLLERLAPRLYLAGPLTDAARLHAALVTSGPESAVTGLWAGRLLVVSRFRCADIVTVTPSQATRVFGGRAIRCSALTSRDIAEINGLRVVKFARCAFDSSADKTQWQVANILHCGGFRGLLDRDLLLECLRRNATFPGPNNAVLRGALALHDAKSSGTRSLTEDRYLGAMIRAYPIVPLVNIHTMTGIGLVEGDFRWEREGLWVELDGGQHA